MKKIIYGSIVLGLIAVASLSSCKKDEVKPINNKDNVSVLSSQQIPFANIKASNNGKSFDLKINDESDNHLEGDFLGSHFNQLTFTSDYQNEINSMTKIENYSYVSSSNPSLKQLSFSNFEKLSDEEFTVDISVNNSTVPVTIYNNGFSMIDFQQNVSNLDSKAEIWWLVAVAAVSAVTWVADSSLEYCQTVITQGTQNCSANGKCAIIGWCSVTCVGCPE